MNNNKLSARKLVFLAFFIALSIILSRIMSIKISISGIQGIRLSLGGFPIVFSGIIFGPVYGFVVGFLADVQGYFINPGGAYLPQLSVTSGLTGLIPGIVFFYFFKQKITFLKILISISTGQFITSVLLVPYFINRAFGFPIKALVISNLIAQIIIIIIYSMLSYRLTKYAKKILFR